MRNFSAFKPVVISLPDVDSKQVYSRVLRQVDDDGLSNSFVNNYINGKSYRVVSKSNNLITLEPKVHFTKVAFYRIHIEFTVQNVNARIRVKSEAMIMMLLFALVLSAVLVTSLSRLGDYALLKSVFVVLTSLGLIYGYVLLGLRIHAKKIEKLLR